MDWRGVLILVAWAYGGFFLIEFLVMGWPRFARDVLESRRRR